MTGPDNFIQRWARLKRASDTAHEIETVSGNVEVTTVQPRTEGVPDQPFDLASLPSLESIAADTDIGAFLQSGVPAELTRAALRRAWASDPAIRDFIGIAENQWDFNDPDAIPGFGPLLSTDGPPAALPQVSSKLESIPEALRELPASVKLERSLVTDPEPTPDKPCFADSGTSDSPDAPEVAGATKSDRTVEEYGVPHNRRRHGSALPR
jgi:hypothetical protein